MKSRVDVKANYNGVLKKYLDNTVLLAKTAQVRSTMTAYNNQRRSKKSAEKRKFRRGEDDFGSVAKESYEGNQYERVNKR